MKTFKCNKNSKHKSIVL